MRLMMCAPSLFWFNNTIRCAISLNIIANSRMIIFTNYIPYHLKKHLLGIDICTKTNLNQLIQLTKVDESLTSEDGV